MSLDGQIRLLAQRVAAVIGLEKDWAAQLTGALNTPQGTLAATKTLPGIVQLATTAQAVAGTNDTAALTALDLVAALRASSPLSTDWALGPNVALWDTQGSFVTEVRRMPGNFAHVEMGVKRTDGLAWTGNQVVLALGSSLRPTSPPASGRTAIVTGFDGNHAGWAGGSVALAIKPDGSVVVNAAAPYTSGLFGSFVFPIAPGL